MTNTPNSNEKIADIIKQVRIAMFFSTGTGADGKHALHSRPMYTYLEQDQFTGTAWFMTDIHSLKAADLEASPEVVLSYADAGKNVYLTLRGKGTITRDAARVKEFWTIHAKAWFPKGPDDPNIGIVRVDVHEAEYWEGPSKIVYAMSVAKAVMTGSTPDSNGEHQHVTL